MNENFFANYKNFVVTPSKQQKICKEAFNPQEYDNYYILTVSLYDSLISNWEDASDYKIDINKSIDKVLNDFNEKQMGNYHVQLLEFVNDDLYFVIALSCKNKILNLEKEIISNYIVNLLSNSFYIGQNWYRLIGNRGRIERKVFDISINEYTG